MKVKLFKVLVNKYMYLFLFFVICFQVCENTTGFGDRFELEIMYPNPMSSNDTLTIGLSTTNTGIETTSIEDIKVYFKNSQTKLLKVTGAKLSSKIYGNLKTNDKYIQSIIQMSNYIVQCVLDTNIIDYGYYGKIEVEINKIKFDNTPTLYIFKGE